MTESDFESAKSACLDLCAKVLGEVKSDLLQVDTKTITQERDFSTKSTVGIMITGVTVDSTVAGGPAFNSKKLSRGDVILKVDGNIVTNENIFQLLVGRDIPGSSVELSVAKGGSQVRLTRMATAEIQDRRRMFEIFNALKDRAISEKETKTIAALDEAIQLWNSMWMADQIHDQTIADNVTAMQSRCTDLLEALHQDIAKLK